MEIFGNLAITTSKSGAHTVLNGRALSASHIKPTKRPNLSSDENFCQNSVGAAASSKDGCRSCAEEKVCKFSFKATSNGGLGGDSVDLISEKIRENKGTDRSNLSDDAQFRKNVDIFRRAFGNDHYLVKAGHLGLFSKDDGQVRAKPSLLVDSTLSIYNQKSTKNADGKTVTNLQEKKVAEKSAFFPQLYIEPSPFADPKFGGVDKSATNATRKDCDQSLSSFVDSTSGVSEKSRSPSEMEEQFRENDGRKSFIPFSIKVDHDQGHGENSFKEAKRGQEGPFSHDERQPNRLGGRGNSMKLSGNSRDSSQCGSYIRGISDHYLHKDDDGRAFSASHHLAISEKRSGGSYGGRNLSDRPGPKEKAGIFRESNGRKFLENNVEIFRKAFGDSHYFVKAGREGCFSKAGHEGCFSKAERQPTRAENEQFLLGDSRPNKEEFREINGGNKNTSSSVNSKFCYLAFDNNRSRRGSYGGGKSFVPSLKFAEKNGKDSSSMGKLPMHRVSNFLNMFRKLILLQQGFQMNFCH